MTKMEVFIEEVGRQSEYVLMAAVQLDKALKERDPKNAFFYIQVLLTASANVSKLLWGVDRNAKARQERQGLRDFFEVDENSLTTDRKMRNSFDHFDERLDEWYEADASDSGFIVDSNLGTSIGGTAINKDRFLRNYDLKTATVSFKNLTFNTRDMSHEAYRIFKIYEKYKSEKRNSYFAP